jgi:hypothetical protein
MQLAMELLENAVTTVYLSFETDMRQKRPLRLLINI